MTDLPLMRGLPRAELPTKEPLLLASGSPRRAELLRAAGYEFSIQPASDEAECGICTRETAPELVARYAFRKAAEIAAPRSTGMILAADTVASCRGQILGKPADLTHARSMLKMLSGREHDVFTGVCLWSVASNRVIVDVTQTKLKMLELTEDQLETYLESLKWEGKAGAFGYQDGNDWLEIVGDGSASNVVGLPMERLSELLEQFDSLAEKVEQVRSTR